MALETTSIYIGILTLLALLYGARVSILRVRHQRSMGTGDHPDLSRAVRAFGNFAEWIPLVLLALAACEVNGAPDLLIHVVGVALVVSRILHPLGLYPDRTTLARTVGVLITWASAAVTGAFLIYAALT